VQQFDVQQIAGVAISACTEPAPQLSPQLVSYLVLLRVAVSSNPKSKSLDSKMDISRLQSVLLEHNQEHLLRYWDDLDNQEKSALLGDLVKVELRYQYTQDP
jgi:hypothetical protein